MAVNFDAKSSPVMDSTASGAVLSFTNNTSITVANNANRALILELCCSAAPGAGVTATWNGVSMTQLTFRQDTAFNVTTYVFGLRAPATGAQTLSVDFGGNSTAYVASLTSLYSVVQTDDATAFQHVTTAEGVSTTASVAVTSTAGNMVVAAHSAGNGAGGQSFTSTNQTNLFTGTSLNNAGAGNRAAGASSLTMTGTISASVSWVSIGIDVQADASPVTSGGTATDAGTTFKRVRFYQSFTQPVVFAVAAPPYAGWDDTLEWPRPPAPRSMAYSAPFMGQTFGVFEDRDNPEDWINWPDFAPARPRLPLYQPWSFVPPPAQVFFPYTPWDDFTRRKQQPLDTQPLAWPPTPVATSFPAMGWINWPDFATRQKPAASFTPWTFIPAPVQVFFPYAPWDDFTRRKQPPLDTQPQAFVSVVVQAAQQVWYPADRWPDRFPAKRIAVDPMSAAFLPLVPSANVIGDWPDFVRRKPQPLDTQPLSWTGQPVAVQQVWFPYDPWPSLIAKKPVPLNFTPASPFIQTPAQVWFPYGPWDDFSRRQRSAIDTQQLAWSSFTPAPTFFFVPNNWPDFAPKARPLVDVRSWSFIPSPAQVFFPYGSWDDFARRKQPSLIYPPTVLVPIHVPPLGYLQWPDFATKKRPPLNYIPLTFVQTIRTPWNELSRWPEMVPIRNKAGLHAALQQFAIRFPGTISQATITGILSAFEVNSDVASITVFVRQSGPAVRAAVSIQEIGTI